METKATEVICLPSKEILIVRGLSSYEIISYNRVEVFSAGDTENITNLIFT